VLIIEMAAAVGSPFDSDQIGGSGSATGYLALLDFKGIVNSRGATDCNVGNDTVTFTLPLEAFSGILTGP